MTTVFVRPGRPIASETLNDRVGLGLGSKAIWSGRVLGQKSSSGSISDIIDQC